MPTEMSNWKQLWHSTTSLHLKESVITSVLENNAVITSFRRGLDIYKPSKKDQFAQLQSKYPEQTKLLNIVQTLQNYVDIDIFQLWDIINNYLCDISYGNAANALKYVTIMDTRPSFLLPNIWRFYQAETLFLLKLLQYVIENKDDTSHKYNKVFMDIYNKLDIKELKMSFINQLSNVINSSPPPKKIHTDFCNENILQEWAEFNLRKQFVILQLLLLIANEVSFSEIEFKKIFELFRKHNFGRTQGFTHLLEERHRDCIMKILYSEVSLFMTILDAKKIENLTSWIDNTKFLVENELVKLQLNPEHSAMLLSWMLITLHSKPHAKLFESQYQQFGATALKLHVFKFIYQLITSSVYANDSKATIVTKLRIFDILNELCDSFDGDGMLGNQECAMELCAELLKTPEVAERFWVLHSKDENIGAVSFWNTALEYFPFNFHSLSLLSHSLAAAGKSSVKNLINELKNLPVYTEIYKPNSVPIAKIRGEGDDVVVGRDYFPLSNPMYKVQAGTSATLMERREGTFIHFRTPYSYWTIFNNEIQKSLDRKGHYNQNMLAILERIWEGTRVLKEILFVLGVEEEIPKSMVTPCEGVFDVLVTFMVTESPPMPLLVSCMQVCNALVPIYPKEIYSRIINTGILPRILSYAPTPQQLASDATVNSAAIGSYLLTAEQPMGTYDLLITYIEMLIAFLKTANEERIISDIVLPGLILLLREVFPNICGWRYVNTMERRRLMGICIEFILLILKSKTNLKVTTTLQHTCVYSFLNVENAFEILKIVTTGNEQLKLLMYEEASWTSGSGVNHLKTIQQSLLVLIIILKLKREVTGSSDTTPLEHLIYAQNRQKDPLKVVPKITSYINHAFNNQLAVLSCRLLSRFANDFKMSLFSCLEMTAYQVRVMFLERLKDDYEDLQLKIAILEFVTTCISRQPSLTEAFFKLQHYKDEPDEKKLNGNEPSAIDDGEGVLCYVVKYISVITANTELLHSPLLTSIMGLLYALWKHNMYILVKDIREQEQFWIHILSPLFREIQFKTDHKTYGQIFNIIGLELFNCRHNINSSLKELLEIFFDINKPFLENWTRCVYSFYEIERETENSDDVLDWLSLLTSWKDFTMIYCKCLPISLNIAHKSIVVPPCMDALLRELEVMRDGRLVVILAELYVIMLVNWKDDCFDNRKHNAKQIDSMLAYSAIVYDSLHPRAKRAILSIGTVAINSLDYEIKANSTLAQSIIRSVTNINSFELGKLFDDIMEDVKEEERNASDVPPIVLSLAMLEQCLELYDDTFSELSQWFHSNRFINTLMYCLHTCLQKRQHQQTSLAALRCLTAYCRGPFSKDLLLSDIDQFLWLRLLPPKFDSNGGDSAWKPEEWWKIYGYSLDFISLMVMRHGQFFVSDAITFIGVHLEFLVESVVMLKEYVSMESLNLCASTLNLVVQVVKYEERWRHENINSLVEIMRSIRACLYHCVMICLRMRRTTTDVGQTTIGGLDDSIGAPAQAQYTPVVMNRIIEVLHMSTMCLLSFSPSLLSLLAEPIIDSERWQPLVELHFGAPKVPQDSFPQLTFGTLLSAINLLTKSLNHQTYHLDEGSGSRSPRARRRCSCGSPGESRQFVRSESITSVSSGTSTGFILTANQRLVAAALEATTTLLAGQALLAVRDPHVPTRDKQLIRRELGSELTIFHDFVRKRILCAAHSRPYLSRTKLGTWPLVSDDDELQRIEESRKGDDYEETSIPPPPPPKRVSQDSMREFILRKHYLDKCAQTPIKDPPHPVSHSTPTTEKKKKAPRTSKRVSWAETTTDSEEVTDTTLEGTESVYSTLTDVQINKDDDYFHLMSIVFLYVCQTDL